MVFGLARNSPLALYYRFAQTIGASPAYLFIRPPGLHRLSYLHVFLNLAFPIPYPSLINLTYVITASTI